MCVYVRGDIGLRLHGASHCDPLWKPHFHGLLTGVFDDELPLLHRLCCTDSPAAAVVCEEDFHAGRLQPVEGQVGACGPGWAHLEVAVDVGMPVEAVLTATGARLQVYVES